MQLMMRVAFVFYEGQGSTNHYEVLRCNQPPLLQLTLLFCAPLSPRFKYPAASPSDSS
jgi:hypothetical protein